MNNFRQRLRSRETLVGTMVTLPTPATAEILADAGYDWLFIDAEHGALDISDIRQIIQCAGHRIPCVVRVPECSEGWIKRVLDLGADGLIVPQINTPQDAANVVQYSRYAPLGNRGVGLGRAHGYGATFDQYLESANERVAVIVQAEHRLVVEHIDRITWQSGIDAVLLGPYDLSASYGVAGQIDDPQVQRAIGTILNACRDADLPVGSFGISAESINAYAQQGCTLLCAGVDAMLLGQAARKLRSALP